MPCIEIASQQLQVPASAQSEPLATAEMPSAMTKSMACAGSLVMICALIAGCANNPKPAHTPAPAPMPTPAPVATAPPAPMPAVVARAAPPATPAASPQQLPAVGSWADYRRRAAQMIIASNPGTSFGGPTPERWQGIAIVTVMLNADGTVRDLDLMRGSRVAPHVNDLAMAAVRRAANYGPVTNLPQPWQFNETFLYNDDNKFQLITIVEGR